MGQLIDTSVFITLERQRLDLDILAQMFPNEPIALAAITASELLAGVYYADTEERRQRRQAFGEQIVTTAPFDLPIGRTYAYLSTEEGGAEADYQPCLHHPAAIGPVNISCRLLTESTGSCFA